MSILGAQTPPVSVNQAENTKKLQKANKTSIFQTLLRKVKSVSTEFCKSIHRATCRTRVGTEQVMKEMFE